MVNFCLRTHIGLQVIKRKNPFKSVKGLLGELGQNIWNERI